MANIKIKEITNPIPSFTKDVFKQSDQEVTPSDWEEYLIALRAYSSAYLKLKNKIITQSNID